MATLPQTGHPSIILPFLGELLFTLSREESVDTFSFVLDQDPRSYPRSNNQKLLPLYQTDELLQGLEMWGHLKDIFRFHPKHLERPRRETRSGFRVYLLVMVDILPIFSS